MTDTQNPFPTKEFRNKIEEYSKAYDDKIRKQKERSLAEQSTDTAGTPAAPKRIADLTEQEFAEHYGYD